MRRHRPQPPISIIDDPHGVFARAVGHRQIIDEQDPWGHAGWRERPGDLYIVHMKRVTASEARRNWFRILDEVAAGEVVVVERNGKAIQLIRAPQADRVREVPDYSGLIRAQEGAEEADRWGWAWDGEEAEVRPVVTPKRKGRPS